MLIKIINKYEHYYEHFFRNEQGQRQGEYKSWWTKGKPYIHCFFDIGTEHGEYKKCYRNGEIDTHCFYVHGRYVSFNEIPYPETEEDCMYFKLKYDLPLIPTEVKC